MTCASFIGQHLNPSRPSPEKSGRYSLITGPDRQQRDRSLKSGPSRPGREPDHAASEGDLWSDDWWPSTPMLPVCMARCYFTWKLTYSCMTYMMPHSRRPLHLQATPHCRRSCGTNRTPPSPAMLYRRHLPLMTPRRDRLCINSWQLTSPSWHFRTAKIHGPGWRWTARHKYPSVAAVDRRLLAIPATSVANKRLFSKAGNVITKKWNCLASHIWRA